MQKPLWQYNQRGFANCRFPNICPRRADVGKLGVSRHRNTTQKTGRVQ